MNWTQQGDTYICEDTDLGFYAIVGRPGRFTAWLHRSDQAKDSVLLFKGSDLEAMQREVTLYDNEATPNTVHRTARRFAAQ